MGGKTSKPKTVSNKGKRTSVQTFTTDHNDLGDTESKRGKRLSPLKHKNASLVRDEHVHGSKHIPNSRKIVPGQVIQEEVLTEDEIDNESDTHVPCSKKQEDQNPNDRHFSAPQLYFASEVQGNRPRKGHPGKTSTLSESELKEQVRLLQAEIKQLEVSHAEVLQENVDLRIRLSSVMGTRLTTNNPNIADLSDSNRPAKLADQFSELYDNEWTDAYEILEKIFQGHGLKSGKRVKVSKEICRVLLQILFKTYAVCNTEATTEMENLSIAYDAVCGEEIDPELSKQVKSKRKKNYKRHLQGVYEVVDMQISSYINNHWKLKDIKDVITKIKPYTDKCVELCWLMVIQDPPVYIFCDNITKKMNIQFDKDLYREYTLPGKKILHIVWPVLYLHKGGPVLKKGVAQGTGNKKQNKTVIGNSAITQEDQIAGKAMQPRLQSTMNPEIVEEKVTPEVDGNMRLFENTNLAFRKRAAVSPARMGDGNLEVMNNEYLYNTSSTF